MSKISEQKALEAYPEDYAYIKCDNEDTNYTEIDDEGTKWRKIDFNEEFRIVYIECYDQAMQDFMEKAEKYIKSNINNLTQFDFRQSFIEQFKNYMQDE